MCYSGCIQGTSSLREKQTATFAFTLLSQDISNRFYKVNGRWTMAVRASPGC